MFKRLSDQDIQDIVDSCLDKFDEKTFMNSASVEQLCHASALIAVSIILTTTKSAYLTKKENTAVLLHQMTEDVIKRILYAMNKVITEKYSIVKED